MHTVGRWALRVPDGSDGPANIPLWMDRLATDLTDVAKDNQGTLAARPASTALAPGVAGRYYRDSDRGYVTRDYGTGWQLIAPMSAAGTYAARPGATAELEGFRYFATDKWMEWLCTGGAWLLIRADPMPVTVLPAGPIDGQRISLSMSVFTPTPVALATVIGSMVFRYRAFQADGVTANPSAYKWEREGLGEVVARVPAQEAPVAGGATWQNTATVGPMFTLPAGIGGDFDFVGHATATATGTQTAMVGVSVNDANPTPIPGTESMGTVAVNGYVQSLSTPDVQKTGLAPGDTVRLKYNSGAAAQAPFSRRSLAMKPVRLG